MPTDELRDASGDLKRAFEMLTKKTLMYTVLWNYYEGRQPLVYTNDRLREVFQNVNARFSENWCAVVIDSERERIRLKEFTLPQPEVEAPQPAPVVEQPAPVSPPPSDDAAPVPPPQPQPIEQPPENPVETRLNEMFSQTELNLDADDVTLAALVCGESYVIAWKDEDGEVEAYYNDPRMCHMFYDPDHPRKKLFAAKWWVGEDDGKRYLNLYYPDRIEYYISTQKAEAFTTWRGMQPAGSEPNPTEEVPVFHFRIDRRKTTSRLDNVIEPQDALNKLFADMMVAAEFGAFKQRYVISAADVNSLKNSPNEIWALPAGDGPGQQTSAGEFSATELTNYISAMDKIAQSIAIISRTPKHYILAQGGDPSGEALIAMEAPLNKKAQSAIDRFKPTWSELAAFLLKLDGAREVPKQDITPMFDPPETVQPRTEAEIRQLNVNAGIPLVTSLRREGWTDSEIAQMQEDKSEGQAQALKMAQGMGLPAPGMNSNRDSEDNQQQVA